MERERDLSLHYHHQNDSCIKIGSDESHFNVSLIVRDKVTWQCRIAGYSWIVGHRIVVDRFLIALFSTLEKTYFVLVPCDSEGILLMSCFKFHIQADLFCLWWAFNTCSYLHVSYQKLHTHTWTHLNKEHITCHKLDVCLS